MRAGAAPEVAMVNAMVKKHSIVELLVERGLAPDRERAAALVLAGAIQAGGQPVFKAGERFPADIALTVEVKEFVGRGAIKLRDALDAFRISAADLVCADVGAATGGFTQILLRGGASRVFAVDVGYGDLDWSLRNDPRVTLLERTNARYVERLAEAVNLAVIDVSFISVRMILPVVRGWLAQDPPGQIVALVKPQFEARPDEIAGGGVVRDRAVHRRVLDDLLQWCEENGFGPGGLVRASITGSAGNQEFFLRLFPGNTGNAGATMDQAERRRTLIDAVLG